MKWNVIAEMDRMHDDMNKVMNSIWVNNRATLRPATQRMRTPLADVVETENNVLATVEIPGAKKEDIDLTITDEAIEIKVEQQQEEQKDGYKQYNHQFFRRLSLPVDVDAEQAKASYRDGVLRVEIPKVEQVQYRKKVDIN